MSLRTSRGISKSTQRMPLIFSRIFFLVVLIGLGAFFLRQEARFSASGLSVWFFDVGQGDAILIQTPHGHQVLVDGGPDQSILSKLGSAMLPWDRTMDRAIVTHNDADHTTGFRAVTETYQVDQVMVAEDLSWREGEIFLRAGDRFVVDGVLFEVLWPTAEALADRSLSDNEQSLVLWVTYQETSLLLTGDIEALQEAQILWPDVDVLKVAHHGSASSSSLDFLRALQPEEAVISCGRENPYGHPHPVILDRLTQVGAKILRTDLDGDILLFVDEQESEIVSSPLPF